MADDLEGWPDRSRNLWDGARAAGCTPAEFELVAFDVFLALSDGARKALVQLQLSGSPEEREFVSKIQGRAVLKAYETVLDHRPRQPAVSADGAVTEAGIEKEAVEACRSGSAFKPG